MLNIKNLNEKTHTRTSYYINEIKQYTSRIKIIRRGDAKKKILSVRWIISFFHAVINRALLFFVKKRRIIKIKWFLYFKVKKHFNGDEIRER